MNFVQKKSKPVFLLIFNKSEVKFMLEGKNKDRNTVVDKNGDKKIELSAYPTPSPRSLGAPQPLGASRVSNVAAVLSPSKLMPSESLAQASGVPSSAAEDDDVIGIISVAFSKGVIFQLKQIQDLMLNSSKSYIFFAENFNKITECLEDLGDNELTNRGKKDIQVFLSKEKFLKRLYQYILKFDDDYRYRNSYKFEKILKRLDLLVNDKSSLCQKQAKYIIYELENILKLFEFLKKQSVPGLNYDYDMLAHFDEIEAVLKIIKSDELEVKYKNIIKKLKERILLEAAGCKKFPFNMYGAVLRKIDALFVVDEKKKFSKKNQNAVVSSRRTSFSGILNSLSITKKSKEKEVPYGSVSNIIFSLECVKEIIQQHEFNKKSTGEKIDDDNLKAQFYIIKDSLMALKSSELNLVNKDCIIKILLDIRLILDQNKFDEFYSEGGEMAEIFSKLEYQCSAQDNDIKDNKIKKSRNRESQQRFSYSAEKSNETSDSSGLEDSKKSDSGSFENSTKI
jgi:hypothetical protein